MSNSVKTTCFFSTWGRVWVHHLSLSSGHCWNSDGWWLSCPVPWSIKTVNSVYPEFIMIHLFAFIYICQQIEKNWVSHHQNGDWQWWPLLIAILAVASTQAQVVNSNSTLAVQDPQHYSFKVFPLDDKTLSLYAQNMVLKQLNSNSCTNISSLNMISRVIGLKIDESELTDVKLTLRGMDRLYGKPTKQASPITVDILIDIGLTLNFDKKFHVTMWAIVLTSFFLLFRKSNVSVTM